jgi:dTDP-4-dehydrorhamnose 3,5-epimerase
MSEPLTGPGQRDQQTVTPDGESALRHIDGLILRKPVNHVDHRGNVFEIYNGDTDMWPDPIVWIYSDIVFPGQIKGWARHEVKVDRYTLISGTLTMLLYDGREDSPTHGLAQAVTLSAMGVRQIQIPVGVWHLLFASTPEEVHFVNMPTQPYHHEAPDRILLPWDTDEIPVDVRHYLPKF